MTAPSTRPRVVLLTIQTFMLGLMLVLVVIPANAIFLAEYGSRGLAYTYLGMAVVGVPSSMLLAAALRRWRLPLVASSAVALSTALFFGSWVALRAELVWVSAILLVLFIVVLQTGFVLVGGQAGRLFDVQQIKVLFPRVVSGFVAGLLAGGLLGPVLLAVFGGTEDMLIGATVAGVLFLAAVIATGRRYAPELALIPQPVDVPRPPLRTLIGKRFVVAILVYQVFSAMGSQLLDFMVFDRAAALYASSEELAQVISIFTAALNGTNLLFLAVLAGPLLRRFGLRLGVNANPMLVSALVAAIVATSVLGGTVSFGLFLLVAGSRIADLTLSDGMTRTSINATYQALPLADRLAVQATVEGVGVPLAIGSAGVILIAADLFSLGFTFVAVATLLLCLVWMAAGISLYRGYRTRLVASLRQRVVEPGALVVDGPTLSALDGLLASDRPADVRLALDALAGAQHPALASRLAELAAHPLPAMRAEALRRFTAGDAGAMTSDLAHRGLRDPDAGVRREAVRLLARDPSHDGASAIAAAGLLDDPDPDVELAALLAVRHGGDAAAAGAVDRLRAMASSPETADRLRLARGLGDRAPGPADALEVELVRILARDQDDDVRAAAIDAAGASGDPVLLPVAVEGLRHGSTASAAVSALPMFGAALLAHTEAVLGGRVDPMPRANEIVRLVRATGGVPGAVPVLDRHVAHGDGAVRLAVMQTLGRERARGALASSDAAPASVAAASTAVTEGATRAARCLAAIRALQGSPGTEHVERALRDEIEASTAVIEAALALRYDARAVSRSGWLLRHGTDGERALATEMLEVTLSAADHAIAMALLGPGLTDEERLRRLARHVPAPSINELRATLEDLALDPDRTWARPWLRVCTVHALGAGQHAALVHVAEAAATDPDPDVGATAAWSLGRLRAVGSPA